MTHIPLDDETVSYILRYGGRCRECADNPSQICVIGGLPCNVDAARKVIRHTITALNYGIEHGFLAIGVPSPSISEAVEVLRPYAEAADSHDPDDRITNWLRSLASSPPSPAGEKSE